MIVVTGMHRSGTSLAALLLEALGADFGPQAALYAADDWNTNGYLERVDAVDLNSRLITGHARTTGLTAQMLSQLNYLRMPGANLIAARSRVLADELRRLGTSVERLAVKDPRFCLTLDAWKANTSVSGLVVALRHPSASVASLRRRNRLPTALGHRFWRWHMEAVLPHIDERTLVIRQDLLTGAGHEDEVNRTRRWLREIADIERPGAPIDVIDHSLVHHVPSSDDVPANSLALWDELVAAPAFL